MSLLNFSWKDHIYLYFKWPTSVNDAGADGYRLSRLFRQLSFLSAKMWQPLQIRTFHPIQQEVGRPKLLQIIFFLWIQYWWIFLFDLMNILWRLCQLRISEEWKEQCQQMGGETFLWICVLFRQLRDVVLFREAVTERNNCQWCQVSDFAATDRLRSERFSGKSKNYFFPEEFILPWAENIFGGIPGALPKEIVKPTYHFKSHKTSLIWQNMAKKSQTKTQEPGGGPDPLPHFFNVIKSNAFFCCTPKWGLKSRG